MSKVFEALEKARKEKSVSGPLIQTGAPRQVTLPEELRPIRATLTPKEHKDGLERLSPWIFVCRETFSYQAEQIKKLKTHILHCSSHFRPPRVILITSAGAGEGKSVVAANLAVSIAQGIEDSALLLDADMRHPSLHTLLGLRAHPGLSDYLAGEASLEDVVQDAPISKLRFIGAGSPRGNPVELISSERMNSLISRERESGSNNFVVIDSTPAVLTSEPRILSLLADAVILVVRYNQVARQAIKETIETLGKEKVVGLFFNDAPLESMKLYEHAYSGYYYGGRKK